MVNEFFYLKLVAANGAPSESVKQSLEQASATPEPANETPSESVKQSLEQASATPRPNANHWSGEFATAQECNECIVQMPEELSDPQLEASTRTPEPQDDDFRTADVRCYILCGSKCVEYHEKAWYMIHSSKANFY